MIIYKCGRAQDRVRRHDLRRLFFRHRKFFSSSSTYILLRLKSGITRVCIYYIYYIYLSSEIYANVKKKKRLDR